MTTALRPLSWLVCLGVLIAHCGQLCAQDSATVTAEPISIADHAAIGQRGMVATVDPLATDAGVRALRLGGNAIDAAVAAALMLGVVDNHNSGLGGGCFVLARLADGTFIAIDGREMAPAAASRDMFVRKGEAVASLSRDGPLAVAVPGALAAYQRVIREHGELPLARMLGWAAERAEQGFVLDQEYASNVREVAKKLDQFPGLKAVLQVDSDQLLVAGDLLRQPDLANTYRQIAAVGIDWFYRGEFANRVAAWMEKNGGLLTREDFANYAVKQRTPLQTTYRDYTIVGFPPPSSGGVHVAQILNILEHFDLAELHRREPIVATHVVVEATKLAFADRAHWLGDADFVSVPRGLASKQYAATLAERIQLDKVIEVPKHSTPDGWEQDLFGGHTAHIAAADDLGNWVAITATVNTTFGSKVIVPGTGIVLNNEMDDFSAQPGVPNVFGLIGAENNSVKPRKRPLSSMSPTIVLQDGRPMLTVGASGGPRIITQVLLAIIRHLDYQMPLDQALAEPRFHHQWVPNEIWCEEAYPVALRVQLEQLGHKLKADDKKGATQAIVWLPERGFLGVHDPRVPGKAAGY